MTYCAERTKLLAQAGKDLAKKLLPEPFELWYSDHSTGCQMTIIAHGNGDPLIVWRGSIWHSSIYEFNDRGRLGGLQPDFEFAKDIIEKYFADVKAAVEERERAAAARRADRELARVVSRRNAIEDVRRQLQGQS
jgi:hypothetical protein